MAIHKSALKRARQNEVRRLRNKNYKTRCKNTIKEVRAAMSDKSTDLIENNFKRAVSSIQKAASKGVMHKSTAARKISRLARLVNQLS